MKSILSTSILLLSFSVFSQNLEKKADDILKEGKELLAMEQASWHATDHFLENYPELRNKIRGYFSYVNHNNDVATVFYGAEEYELLARYLFKGTPSPERLTVTTDQLMISDPEATLLEMRKAAFNDMRNNEDAFYSFYENVNPNLIPIIFNGVKKVYIISGSSQPQMLLGNDYRLVFDEDNQITQRVQLHKSLIPFNYEENKTAISSVHTHIISDFINVTDVCTLLLYKKYTGIGSHTVMSKKYVSILDLEKETLLIMTKKAWEKISEVTKEK